MRPPEELWTVARRLDDPLGDVVFVGGMVRELLITDPTAEREDHVADAEVLGRTEGDRRHVLAVDLQDGDVAGLVPADDAGPQLPAVGQAHGDA